jgi:hypothetical protein
MSRRLARLALAAALAGGLGCASTAPPPSAAPPEGAELEGVMGAIQEALSEGETREIAGFPPLKTVTIKLQTEASRSLNGEIGVYVFSVGSRYSAESASTLELTMEPPRTRPEKGVLPPGDLKQALAREIFLAKVGVARAAQGDPPFVMKDITIDLKFAVEISGAAGANVKLVPLGVEAGGKLNRNQVHSVTLVFGH